MCELGFQKPAASSDHFFLIIIIYTSMRYVMYFYFTPFQTAISFSSKRSSLVSAITLADVFPNFILLP